MIMYGIGILSLINNLKRSITRVTWYAENAGALVTFVRLETYFDSLTRQGPGRGYHPEPTKSLLIVLPEDLEADKVFGARHIFKMCTVPCYLGGYIFDDESTCDWFRYRTLS